MKFHSSTWNSVDNKINVRQFGASEETKGSLSIVTTPDIGTSQWITVALDISKSKFNPNYWYLKVNFLVPENLLGDISGLR